MAGRGECSCESLQLSRRAPLSCWLGVQVCAYALGQHRLDQELRDGVLLSPFMRALQLADGTVSVVDRDGEYFRR